MAARDLRAFGTFVSSEALFYGRTVLRGREAVVAGWARLFEGAAAPFSWEPGTVDVLDSGTMAMSSGPVRDPSGKIVGTFSRPLSSIRVCRYTFHSLVGEPGERFLGFAHDACDQFRA